MVPHVLQRAFTLISRIGADPSESDDERLHRILLVGAVCSGFINLTLSGALYTYFGEPRAGALYFIWEALQAVTLLLFATRRISLEAYGRYQFTALFTASLALMVVLGGFTNTSGQVLYSVLAPLGALIMFGHREARIWLAGYIALIVVDVVLEFFSPLTGLPLSFVLAMLGLHIIAPLLFVFGILFYFVGQRDSAFRLLRDEQEKSEALVLNILPKEIASILKNENRTIADHYDGASILFADVVDFTPLSAEMAPAELVGLLNEVFSHFDTLVERHGLEKIKTIGDCYMVASGVPRTRPDHAHVLTRMALEIRDYVGRTHIRGRRLTFRIGLNSGSVVAGVIGRKKFIYDLWGDAVNTASRMESHGAGGVIQITRSTYDLIKDDFLCERRGTISVKGKGEMDVWHVVGER